jgi:hypothetical protein
LITANSKTRSVTVGSILIAVLFVAVWWYIDAEDFSETQVSGQYTLIHDGITQRLTLKRDHTFEQEDNANGTIKHANGTWRVFSSTGHVAFSSSFLDARDSWRGQEQHDVYAVFKNYFGIISITFDPDTSPVKTYKELFS